MPSGLIRHKTQEMSNGGPTRIGFKKLPAQRFRLCQITALVMAHSEVKKLGKRHAHCHTTFRMVFVIVKQSKISQWHTRLAQRSESRLVIDSRRNLPRAARLSL